MLTNIVVSLSVVIATNWTSFDSQYATEVRPCKECGQALYYKPQHDYGYIVTNTFITVVQDGKSNVALLSSERNDSKVLERWTTNKTTIPSWVNNFMASPTYIKPSWNATTNFYKLEQ